MDDAFMPDLTKAILAKTSGSPCARLRDQACDFVDGALDLDRCALIQAHLDHCPGCTALVAALREAGAALPAMAEVDPGPWFAQRVLRATVHAPQRAFDARSLWWRLMHRPRIALEAAYLGAVAGLMGLYLSMPASLNATPALVQTLSPKRLVQPLEASAQRVVSQVLQAEQRTAATLQRPFHPSASSEASSLTLWQRGSARLRAWMQVLRRAPQKAAKPVEEKRAPAPNP